MLLVVEEGEGEVEGEEERRGPATTTSLQIHRQKSKRIRPRVGPMKAKLTSFCVPSRVERKGVVSLRVFLAKGYAMRCDMM